MASLQEQFPWLGETLSLWDELDTNMFDRQDALLSILASSGNEAVAGLEGLLYPGTLDERVRIIENRRQNPALSYTPRTAQGREAVEFLGKAVGEPYLALQEGLGDAAYESTGSPLAGAAGYVAPDLLLSALGLRGLNRASVDPYADMRWLESSAPRLADPEAPPVRGPQTRFQEGAVRLGENTYLSPDESLLRSVNPEGGIFYSMLEDGIGQLPDDFSVPASYAAKQVVARMPGAAQREADEIGLSDWLASKGNNRVTKKEIEDYVDVHKVDISEVRQRGRELGSFEAASRPDNPTARYEEAGALLDMEMAGVLGAIDRVYEVAGEDGGAIEIADELNEFFREMVTSDEITSSQRNRLSEYLYENREELERYGFDNTISDVYAQINKVADAMSEYRLAGGKMADYDPDVERPRDTGGLVLGSNPRYEGRYGPPGGEAYGMDFAITPSRDIARSGGPAEILSRQISEEGKRVDAGEISTDEFLENTKAMREELEVLAKNEAAGAVNVPSHNQGVRPNAMSFMRHDRRTFDDGTSFNIIEGQSDRAQSYGATRDPRLDFGRLTMPEDIRMEQGPFGGYIMRPPEGKVTARNVEYYERRNRAADKLEKLRKTNPTSPDIPDLERQIKDYEAYIEREDRPLKQTGIPFKRRSSGPFTQLAYDPEDMGKVPGAEERAELAKELNWQTGHTGFSRPDTGMSDMIMGRLSYPDDEAVLFNVKRGLAEAVRRGDKYLSWNAPENFAKTYSGGVTTATDIGMDRRGKLVALDARGDQVREAFGEEITGDLIRRKAISNPGLQRALDEFDRKKNMPQEEMTTDQMRSALADYRANNLDSFDVRSETRWWDDDLQEWRHMDDGSDDIEHQVDMAMTNNAIDDMPNDILENTREQLMEHLEDIFADDDRRGFSDSSIRVLTDLRDDVDAGTATPERVRSAYNDIDSNGTWDGEIIRIYREMRSEYEDYLVETISERPDDAEVVTRYAQRYENFNDVFRRYDLPREALYEIEGDGTFDAVDRAVAELRTRARENVEAMGAVEVAQAYRNDVDRGFKNVVEVPPGSLEFGPTAGTMHQYREVLPKTLLKYFRAQGWPEPEVEYAKDSSGEWFMRIEIPEIARKEINELGQPVIGGEGIPLKRRGRLEP